MPQKSKLIGSMEERTPSRRVRFWLELLFSACILVAAFWIYYHRQLVTDQIVLWRYTPPANIVAIAQTDSLTSTGERYLYVSRPELQDKATFSRYCPSNTEKTVVLGCYANQRIYIYNVNDARLPYVEEVTSAHEMLHAAYERLSDNERARVDHLVAQASEKLLDPRLINLTKIYQKTEPGQLLNEMHSILATEVSDLPDELEQYYSQYFSDRQKVVAMTEQYESVFTNLKAQQQTLLSDIKSLVTQINDLTNSFNVAVAEFQADVTSFNERASSGVLTQGQYDQQRSALLQRQSSLSAERTSINQLVSELSAKQDQLKQLAIEVSSLNQSLGSETPTSVPNF